MISFLYSIKVKCFHSECKLGIIRHFVVSGWLQNPVCIRKICGYSNILLDVLRGILSPPAYCSCIYSSKVIDSILYLWMG